MEEREPRAKNREFASASAPAKLILCGEHAVVYGRPAIALPLNDVRARAEIAVGRSKSGVRIHTLDLGDSWSVRERPDHPLSELVVATLCQFELAPVDLEISLTSTIPIASGMGSGAAVATALVRALASYFDSSLDPEVVSALVYTSEQRFHGTPSGIDNTVVAFEQPIWFVRGKTKDKAEQGPSPSQSSSTITPIVIASPLHLVIGDTGVRSATRLPVGEVGRRWQAEPTRYEQLFDQVGALVMQSRTALAHGDMYTLGTLLNANQALLQRIGVSSPELEHLISAARAAGALGAKLSGAGWGGVMLALVPEENSAVVAEALRHAGAVRVLETTVALCKT